MVLQLTSKSPTLYSILSAVIVSNIHWDLDPSHQSGYMISVRGCTLKEVIQWVVVWSYCFAQFTQK